jgi:CHRD domain
MRTTTTIKFIAAGAVLATASVGLIVGNDVGAAGTSKAFAAGLVGANEVGGGDPDGTGSASITIDTGTNELCWDVKVSGISNAAAAHIHNAAAGANGPVKVDFAGALSGCLAIAAALSTDIVANPANYYVNIHSSEHAGGAIRGQLSAPAAGPAGYFGLSTPVRAYDSRQTGGTRMKASETRVLALVTGKNSAGVSFPAVPLGAVAAQVVITVTETGAKGYLTAHAAGTPIPEASVINWYTVGSDLATGTVVPVDAAGRLALSSGPTSDTHVIVDVIGYYLDPATSAPAPTSTTSTTSSTSSTSSSTTAPAELAG